MVGRPSSSLKTSYSGYFLSGASNPDKPLYLNGFPVTTRSPKGYFGLFVPLSQGKNTFVLSQEGLYEVRSIWRNKYSSGGSTAPAKMKTAEIPASSVFPQNPLYGRSGETYTFSCTAPIGAKVTVKIGGKIFAMTPGTKVKPGTGAYPTTYRYTWKMPAQTGAVRVVNLGAPVYRMVYAGKAKSRTAPGKIGIVMPGAPIYAQMLDGPTATYDEMSTSGGTIYYLDKGTTEAVTGMYGGYVRLASGLYARKTAVKIITPKTALSALVSGTAYIAGTPADKFLFSLSSPVAVTADFDGHSLRVRIPLVSSLDLPVLPPDGLFETVFVQKNGSGRQYVFILRAGARLDGYELVKTETGYEIPLKRHIPSLPGDMPLAGKSILLDPGHGGSNSDPDEGDTGAIGPVGALWPERNINLSNALVLKAELEKLGANVSMTRATDTSVTLKERLAISRLLHPDLFISLHADSAEDNVDISRLSGFSVWYREPLAFSFGDAVLRSVVDGLGKKDRMLNKSNFYVVRGTWAPSILIETGFVPNPVEFENLTNPAEQTRMMSAIAGAVAAWFAQ
jgi:N-acetylmuramoyl-L-alanine amidase